jgi:hypothetical protein
VETLVAKHRPTEHAGPERALGVDVGGVEHNHLTYHLHGSKVSTLREILTNHRRKHWKLSIRLDDPASSMCAVPTAKIRKSLTFGQPATAPERLSVELWGPVIYAGIDSTT